VEVAGLGDIELDGFSVIDRIVVFVEIWVVHLGGIVGNVEVEGVLSNDATVEP
jgi:hypothetical protein